jgi:hypothetical protein
MCDCVPRGKRVHPFIVQGSDLIDLFSARERERERERERDWLLRVVVRVLRMVVCSCTPGMAYYLARSSYTPL